MEDTLISFETAKLAKEKGFPQCGDIFANEIHKMDFWEYASKAEIPEWRINGYGEAATEIISAPTKSLLQKWLRSKLIVVYVFPHRISGGEKTGIRFSYSACDYSGNELFSDESLLGFLEYEQALEEGLIEGLKLIIG